MKIQNLKYIFSVNWGAFVYERYRNRKWGKLVVKTISYVTEKRLLGLKSQCERVRFDDINLVEQATHPDIIVEKGAFGGKYILTVSGYPFNLAKYENQFVFTSGDGVNFNNVIGSGAIATYEGEGHSHYSDGEMAIYDGKIILFYRMCYEDCVKPHVVIYARESKDLLNWGEEKQIFMSYATAYLSPSIIKSGEKYEMYYVDREEDRNVFKCKASNSIYFDDNPMARENTLINEPPGRRLWHLDIVRDDNVLRGLFAFTVGKFADDTRLYYAKSLDNGVTWHVEREILLDINYRIVKRVYRSTMVKENGTWSIYASVCTKNNCWFLLRSKGHVLD